MQKRYEGKWTHRAGRRFRQRMTPGAIALLGTALVAAGFLPYLILGKGSVITVNDQLDGEIFTYIYQAKYWGSGQNLIPDWMGGIRKEALFPPAVLAVLLYRIFPAFTAFLVNQFLVAETAFLGMYVFLKKLTDRAEISFAAALLFAYLPFYSVYGLTVAGIPMLAFCFWELSEQKHPVRNFLLAAVYGLMSSFVLLGYAVAGLLFCYCLVLLFQKERKRAFFVSWGFMLLTAVYALCNRDLINQVLGLGAAQISHKTEYVLRGLPFWRSFWDMLRNGSGHAPSCHGWMLYVVSAVLAAGLLCRKKLTGKERREIVLLGILLLSAVLTAAFYALYHSEAVCGLRQSVGGFAVYFQLDRIYWFYPFLWYVMLGLMLSLLSGILQGGAGMPQKDAETPVPAGMPQRNGKALAAARYIVTAAVLLTAAASVLWNSDLKRNVRQLLNPLDSNAVTWEKYYGEEIFTGIQQAIGRSPEEYRVGSVALNPAVAAFNGFYTIDGYSNNYDLAYKHAFREIIAGELEWDEELGRYFDEWGNRCYLFTAQLGQRYYVEDNEGITLSGLDWDVEKLRELGCEYLFSGVEITDAKRMGLELFGSFTAAESDCRYKIWVYSAGRSSKTQEDGA